jgi:quercetin dioxygenase-like cupin family protein
MEVSRFENYKDGWFVGDFFPSAYKTNLFEVCYKFHKKGEVWDKHYHKVSTEINYLIEGEMIIQEKKLKSGDVFVIHPYEIADPEFISDCKLIIIKTPSSTKDKYTI